MHDAAGGDGCGLLLPALLAAGRRGQERVLLRLLGVVDPEGQRSTALLAGAPARRMCTVHLDHAADQAGVEAAQQSLAQLRDQRESRVVAPELQHPTQLERRLTR